MTSTVSPEHPGNDADAARPAVVTQPLACPYCEYDLRGLTSRICPECGRPYWVEKPDEADELARLDRFLASRSVRCKKCRSSLRGIKGGVCPECGTSYRLQSTMRRSGARPVSAEPDRSWAIVVALVVAVSVLLVVAIAITAALP